MRYLCGRGGLFVQGANCARPPQARRLAFEIRRIPENAAHIVMADCGGERFKATALALDDGALGVGHAIDQIVEPLLAAVDQVHHAGESLVLGKFREILTGHQELIANTFCQPAMQAFQLLVNFLARADHQFGCGGRCGRTQVGDKIDDGEIRLVSDGGDDGNSEAAMARASSS